MAQQIQFSVFLPNKPGMLAHLCQVLAAKGINLRAISVAETTEQSLVRFVAHSPARVRKVLSHEGIAFGETNVLVVTMPDRPGALGQAAAKFAAAKVNINYVYSGATAGKGKAAVVFGVSDIQKALDLLKG